MAQRTEAKTSLDDFPTPPWATRALMEHVIGGDVSTFSCLEPACGVGHMSRALREHFGTVISCDIHNYGYGEVRDFLRTTIINYISDPDWVITNPPFRLAEAFAIHALGMARQGVAILARTVFLESVGRYERLFSLYPPRKVAQFTERVGMVKGRLDRHIATATGYCWIVWLKDYDGKPELTWIPPCRKNLERDSDY